MDLTYPALRIIFVTAQACDGALAGRHRGLDAWSWLTSMLKVDCDRRQRINCDANGVRPPSFAVGASVSRPGFVFVWSAMCGHSYTVGILAKHTSQRM